MQAHCMKSRARRGLKNAKAIIIMKDWILNVGDIQPFCCLLHKIDNCSMSMFIGQAQACSNSLISLFFFGAFGKASQDTKNANNSVLHLERLLR